MKKIFSLLLVFPFLYSCSDADNEEVERNEKIIEAIKAMDEYKDAYNFRDFKESYTDFEDLNWYKTHQALLKQHEDDLDEAIEKEDTESIKILQQVVLGEKQGIEHIRFNYTKPCYIVTYNLPDDHDGESLLEATITCTATLNTDFVFLGLF